jgi:hypothetical protein
LGESRFDCLSTLLFAAQNMTWRKIQFIEE